MHPFFVKFRAIAKRCRGLRPAYTYLCRICYGEWICKRFLQTVGQDGILFVMPCKGSGDACIVGAMLETYCRKKWGEQPWCIIAVDDNMKKIGSLFHITRIYTVSKREMYAILSYFRFLGEAELPFLKILHFDPDCLYSNILPQFDGYRGLNFYQMYLQTVFDGVSVDYAKAPVSHTVSENEANYWAECGLIPGRTVILAPHANTLDPLPLQSWSIFAATLQAKNIVVLTNIVSGQKPVPGTVGIAVTYNNFLQLVETAGFLVGLRSGIFEIAAWCKCRKYILYPEPDTTVFGTGSFYDFFSVKSLQHDVSEWRFDRKNTGQIFNDILKDISSYVEEMER